MAELNLMVSLWEIAPILGLLFTISVVLWRRLNDVQEKSYEKDLANIKTLEKIAISLSDVKHTSSNNIKELKDHIDDRIITLKEVVRSHSGRS